MYKKLHQIIMAAIILIGFTLLVRLLPHPLGATPIGAAGLFAGAYLSHQRAWLIPIMALFLSDAIIGFYQPLSMLFVYMGAAASTYVGRSLLYKKCSVVRLTSATFISATIFFILSNLGVWLTGLYYPQDLTGIINCYLRAIPFFQRSLLGDLFYVALLFGAHQVALYGIHKRHAYATE